MAAGTAREHAGRFLPDSSEKKFRFVLQDIISLLRNQTFDFE